MTNLALAPISADPDNDVDPRTAGDTGEPASPNVLGGMNQGGCQSVVGANTGEKSPKTQDWDPAMTVPVQYTRLGWGGDSIETGQEDADIVDAQVADYENLDYNDNAAFALADTQAAPGVAFDVAVTGAVNRTEVTIEIGESAWGTIPVL